MANFLRIGEMVLNVDRILWIRLDAIKHDKRDVALNRSMVVVVMAMARGCAEDFEGECFEFFDDDATKLRGLFAGSYALRQSEDFPALAQIVDLNDPEWAVKPEEAIES